MQHITDKRKNPTCKTSQIISLVLSGFLLRIQSFNQLNNMIKTDEFKESKSDCFGVGHNCANYPEWLQYIMD